MAEMEGTREGMKVFLETGSNVFSSCSLLWREVCIGRFTGISSFETVTESTASGGAFHFQGSGQVSSTCRNRSILWRYYDNTVELVELSWDRDLANNALRLCMSPEYGPLLSNLNIHELASHVVILFTTVTTVFRLVLPHPETIVKDPKLSSAGKGLQPSILTFARDDSLKGNNAASIITGTSDVIISTCSSYSWIGMDGVATFAIGSPNGSIYCVKLPPPGTNGFPERFELQERSVIKRFWNMLPSGMRGGDDYSHAPLALCMHSFSGELVLIVVYKDLSLRLWSIQQQECLMNHSLLQYLPKDLNPENLKLSLHNATDSSSDVLRFVVYFGTSTLPQLSIFQLVLMENQLILDWITNYCIPQGYSIKDISLTSDSIWMLLIDEDGKTQIKCCDYQEGISRSTKDAVLLSYPLSDIVLSQNKDPREGYLDEIFAIDKFSHQAILKALQLYGSPRSLDVDCTCDKLRDETIKRIEEEVRSAARSCELSHDDYRELVVKCWNKFYSCCLQYQQLVRRPLGISHDQSTGMTVIMQSGTFSFLYSREDHTHYFTVNQSNDITQLLESIDLLHKQLSPEVFESFLSDLRYHGDAQTMANDIASAVLSEERDDVNEFIMHLQELCVSISDIQSTLDDIINNLNPLMINYDDGSAPSSGTGLDIAIADLYSSSLSCRLISNALCELCCHRLQYTRDLIIVLCVLKLCSFNVLSLSDGGISQYIDKFIDILYNYHILYILGTAKATPVHQTTLDANLKMLSELNISDDRLLIPSGIKLATGCSILEVYVSSVGRGHVMRSLLHHCPFVPGIPVHDHWTNVLPWILDILLQQIWPQSMYLNIYQFLLVDCQYNTLQMLHTMMLNLVDRDWASREFLTGQSYLFTGEIDKAIDCFVSASSGINTEPLLMRLSGDDGNYWIKVMRLVEDVGSKEGIVHVTSHATSVIPQGHPSLLLLWSNLFKYSLQLQLYELAYDALINNPDIERRRECLKHFVVVLTEQQQLKELCNYNYAGMEEEVEHVMEIRARSVDVFHKHCYYDLLYCYYTSREKYWRAAHVMYEYGLRCGLESSEPRALQKQANCYITCIMCLKLVNSKYHWIVKPLELIEQDSSLNGGKVECKVLSLLDIEKSYEIVRSKLVVLQKYPSFTQQLCNPYVMGNDLQVILCQVGLFDDALKLSEKCNLSLKSVYESLAIKCAHLSNNLISSRGESTDTTIWDWLSHNDTTYDIAQSSEGSVLDQAWNMLRIYINKRLDNYELQECVISKLLLGGSELPQWLIDIVKENNPSGLLRIYLQYDYIEYAVLLIIEYIDAIIGHGKEYFGLKNALHVTSPSVWLPFTSIDHVMNILTKAPDGSPLNELQESLQIKLDEYFGLLEDTSSNMKYHSRLVY